MKRSLEDGDKSEGVEDASNGGEDMLATKKSLLEQSESSKEKPITANFAEPVLKNDFSEYQR